MEIDDDRPNPNFHFIACPNIQATILRTGLYKSTGLQFISNLSLRITLNSLAAAACPRVRSAFDGTVKRAEEGKKGGPTV